MTPVCSMRTIDGYDQRRHGHIRKAIVLDGVPPLSRTAARSNEYILPVFVFFLFLGLFSPSLMYKVDGTE